MPAAHQRVRRSAWLRANARGASSTMDLQESPSEGPPPEASGPKMSIQWQNELGLTNVLVNYLTTHPSDCRILFYSEGKKKTAVDVNPSDRDKNDVHDSIAHLIFATHIKYGPAYFANKKRCRDLVSNCITTSKYKKHKNKFTTTGAGIMLLDGPSAQNLLEVVCADLPWYQDLNAIWHGNPAMVAKTHSSKPGVDHAAAFYSLVQPHGRAGPSSAHLPPSPYPAPSVHPPPNAYPAPSAHLPPSPYPAPGAHLPPSPYPAPAPSPYPAPSAHMPPNPYPAPSAHPLPNPYPPRNSYPPPNPAPSTDLPPNPYPPKNAYPPLHLPGLDNTTDVDITDDFGPDGLGPANDSAGPFFAPVDGDDMMESDMGHKSPSRAAGKKCQLPSSPSPPPHPPHPFEMPPRLPASFYNSRAAFGAQRPVARVA
ncbi:hypothetical protein DFH29DRAFT_1006822 [Suillus ampliporus]|nr:hypothetical protein DFH29DRAFT_1006822 [Suillus ampliporus]